MIKSLHKLFKSRSLNRLTDERGIAFVTTILLLIVLALLIAGATQWTAHDIKRTADNTKTRDSFYTAETGINRALDFLNYDPVTGKCIKRGTKGYDDELLAASTGGGAEWPNSLFSHPDNGEYKNGFYDVTLTNNNDGGGATTDLDKTVMLTSRGMKKGVPVTVEAVINRGLVHIDGGLITEGPLKFHGNASVLGEGGTAHSNDVLNESGSSIVASKGTTATADCQGTTTCKDPWFEKEKEVPYADYNDYTGLAHFTLHGDGADNGDGTYNSFIDVKNNSTDGSYAVQEYQSSLECVDTNCRWETLIDGVSTEWVCDSVCSKCWIGANNPSSSCADIMAASGADPANDQNDNDKNFNDAWTGLAPDGSDWKVGGVVPDGVFTVEGSMVVGGTGTNPDGTEHIWDTTLLLKDNLKLGANARVNNFMGGVGISDPESAESLLLFSVGRDMRIVGNAQVGVGPGGTKGWISVRDQFDISGTMDLHGFILASDICISNTGGKASAEIAADKDPDVCPGEKGYTTYNDLGGNATITYDLDIDPELGSCEAKIVTWREIPNAG